MVSACLLRRPRSFGARRWRRPRGYVSRQQDRAACAVRGGDRGQTTNTYVDRFAIGSSTLRCRALHQRLSSRVPLRRTVIASTRARSLAMRRSDAAGVSCTAARSRSPAK